MSTDTTETTEIASNLTAGPNAYTAGAKEMVDNIHAMSRQVPKFVVPADENATRKLGATATVPLMAIAKIVAMIQRWPLLTGSNLGPDEIRDRVDYASAYGPVVDEIDAFSTALRHSVIKARSEAGRTTLNVYEVAKRESKRPESAALRPHVADLKRLLSRRFGGRPKAVKAPQAPTESSSMSDEPGGSVITEG